MRSASHSPTSAGPAPTCSARCCARCGASCGCAVPHCLDLSLVRAGERGLCRAELVPDVRPVPLRVPTSWTLVLTDARARPLDGAWITADGGMPQRGARYPIPPSVTALERGSYRVVDLEFTAPGWWLLRFVVAAPIGDDVVTFNLVLE